VTVGGNPIDLTAQEFRILNYFMHQRGRVISQSQLLDHLYCLETERDPNTVEVYVARLRRKLGRDSIKTLRGLGYRSDERVACSQNRRGPPRLWTDIASSGQ